MGVNDQVKLVRELFNSYRSRMSLERVLIVVAVFVSLGSAVWLLSCIFSLLHT